MCGVAAAVAIRNHKSPRSASLYVRLILRLLQARGQESAGIGWQGEEGELKTHKGIGLVSDVLTDQFMETIPSGMSIGHVRYSTTGGSVLANAQPHVASDRYNVSVVHNGNLVNCQELSEELTADGVTFRSTSDTERIAWLIARSAAPTIEEAVVEVCGKIKGSYALLVMAADRVIAVRDPFGIRPLSLGKISNEEGNFYILTSESCVYPPLDARNIYELAPGQMLSISQQGVTSRDIQGGKTTRFCLFEFIYFGHPASTMEGQSLYGVRYEAGRRSALAEEPGFRCDIVIPVPDSGMPAAIGYSAESGVPYGMGLIRNRYQERTFTAPDGRSDRVRMKLTPNPHAIAGKRVVLLDDSIVRGVTNRRVVQILRDAGAREVHVRIASPPDKYPCHYGIDTSGQDELIAARMSVEEIRRYISADSLHFLSLEDTVAASGCPKSGLCTACFDGDYPIPIESGSGKRCLE